MSENFPISNDVIVNKIMETGSKVVSIETKIDRFLKDQEETEATLDSHDKRIRSLEDTRHGDRRFIAALLFVLSPLAAYAVAWGKQYLGI